MVEEKYILRNKESYISIMNKVTSFSDVTLSHINYLIKKGYSPNNFIRTKMKYLLVNDSTKEILGIYDSIPVIKNSHVVINNQIMHQISYRSVKIIRLKNYLLPEPNENYIDYVNRVNEAEKLKIINKNIKINTANYDLIKANIYQIYFEEGQKKQLYDYFIPYYNKSANKYLETQVILDVRKQDNSNTTHTGVLSYSFTKKTGHNDISVLQKINDNKEHALGFQMKGLHSNKHAIFKIADHCHKHMSKIAQLIFDKMGMPQVLKTDYYNAYCNFYVYQTPIFNQYVDEFLQPIIDIIEDPNNEEIQSLINSDATYFKAKHMNKSKLNSIFGHNYYTYHPFFFERLPGVFLHEFGYKQKLIF